MTAPISRRRALALLAGAGAGVAVGAGVVWSVQDDDRSPGDPVPPAVEGELAVIGQRYLEQFPEEASVEALSRAVDGTVPPGGGAGAPDFAALRGRIRAELDRSEVARVDGWVLSRTEARLCALVALGG